MNRSGWFRTLDGSNEGSETFITGTRYGVLTKNQGRAGRLVEAVELIYNMPMTPSPGRVHGEIDMGEKIGKMLIELEPQNGGRYALLSNIYAKAGRWEDVEKVRTLMKENGVKTTTGRTTIDIDGTVHEFKIGDSNHH
ncbi:hypothetical protein M8C21_024345 [Ambrosia artemisiifolia]|uniref:Pentatricopeptide repeat-containing protein n=1 Tax=Ambrosia artemisiifolia TaxID=4212 RepID=A0AAD5BQ14_AMBAR|nr:hypothetical protein M8C21_024345 [Ambrosia artemisiifolia]